MFCFFLVVKTGEGVSRQLFVIRQAPCRVLYANRFMIACVVSSKNMAVGPHAIGRMQRGHTLLSTIRLSVFDI